MRVLSGVRGAEFDIPSETFTVGLPPGGDPKPVFDAIRGLGYEPVLLDAPPRKAPTLERVQDPSSPAVKAALARARSRGVPLVLDFGGPFCVLCKKFEETTLTKPEVKDRLTAFEFVRVDIEADPAAAKDFGVKGVPDIWFLVSDGRVVGRENRYLTTDEFLTALDKHRTP